MMRQVEIAEPEKRNEVRGPGQMPGPFVQTLVAEGRTMGRLVFEREEKGDQHTLHDDQQRPERETRRNPCATQPDRAEMERRAVNAARVSASSSGRVVPVAGDMSMAAG